MNVVSDYGYAATIVIRVNFLPFSICYYVLRAFSGLKTSLLDS